MDNKGNVNNAVNPLGAAYYVVAVILIYALSIVMLIASRVRRKHAKILEDRQILKYLQEFQTVREKSHRDTYRNLKRMVIAQLGPNRLPKTAYCNLGQAIMPAVAVAMPSSTEVQRLAGAHRFSIISGGPEAGGGVEGADGSGEIPGEGEADSDESSTVFVDDSPVSIFFPDVNAMLHHERRESMRSRRCHHNDDCTDCDCDVSYDKSYASSGSDDGRDADGSKASMTSRNSRAGGSGSSARRYGSQYTRQEGRESRSNNERRRRSSFTEVLIHSSGDVHASGNVKRVGTHHSHHHSHHHHHSRQHGGRVEVAAVSRLKRDAYAESYQHLVYHPPVATSSLSPARRAQSMHANGRMPPHLRGQSSLSSDNFTSHSETPSRTRKQQQQSPSGTPSKVAVGRRHTAPYGRHKKSSRHYHQPRAEQQTHDDTDYADDSSSHANEVDVNYTQTTAALHNDHERVVDDKTAVAASAVNPVCDEVGQRNSITLSHSPVTTITLPHQQFLQQQQQQHKSRSRIQSDIVTDATHCPSPRPVTRQSLPTPSAAAAGLLKVPLVAFGDSGGGRKKLQLATVLPMPPQSPRRPASLAFELSTAAAHSADKRQCTSASSLPTTVIVSQPSPVGTPGQGQGQHYNEATPL
jgi:hypothetical protein